MRFLVRATFALLLTTGLAAPIAQAEDLAVPALKTPAKPAVKAKRVDAPSAKATAAKSTAGKERRPGELEGWDSGLKGPVVAKAKRPPDAVGEKASSPDGGLPLPEPRISNDPSSPVGFDKSGNMGSTFKF